VAKVVADLGPRAVGELDDAGRTAKLEAAVAGAGWRELRAEGDGGPLASGVEAAIVAEELSRGAADVPYLGPTLAAELRRRAGAPAAVDLEGIVLTRDLAGLAPADGAAIAVDVAGAAGALALRPLGDGHGVVAVALGDATTRTDLTRAVAATTAATREVDASRALTDADLTASTALGLALTSAELVGTMQGALTLATDYAKERRQYGTAVGSFQAVQHLLADAAVAIEGARSLALHAAWAVDALAPPEALASGAAAKAYASRAARSVCETAIQVHGGIGNTWECLAHVHLRRALLSIDCFGGVGPSLARVLDHEAIGGTRGLR
jgi:hypothetical protein